MVMFSPTVGLITLWDNDSSTQVNVDSSNTERQDGILSTPSYGVWNSLGPFTILDGVLSEGSSIFLLNFHRNTIKEYSDKGFLVSYRRF